MMHGCRTRPFITIIIVSIPAATSRSGNTTAKYRRKACSIYMESEECDFLATYPPDDRHAEPQAVGGSDTEFLSSCSII